MAERPGSRWAAVMRPPESTVGDAVLYVRLVEVGFAGPDFDVVADALVRYAYPVLCSWLASGHIVEQGARMGVRGLSRLGSGTTVLTRHDVEDLVQETLRRALERFVVDGRTGRGWSPDGGAALRTYFVGSCVLRFGDVYRAWERDQRQARPFPDSHLLDRRSTVLDDPADLVILREKIAEKLPPDGPRRTEILLHHAGYSDGEIARILGDGTTAGAVANRRYRYRKNLGGGQQP